MSAAVFPPPVIIGTNCKPSLYALSLLLVLHMSIVISTLSELHACIIAISFLCLSLEPLEGMVSGILRLNKPRNTHQEVCVSLDVIGNVPLN